MPWSSRWSLNIPSQTLPSYVFTSPTASLSSDPVLLDADKSAHYYLTLSTFRLWSQRFAAGLRAAGLQPGDRVLLFSGNTLFFPVVFLGTIMAGGIFTGANPGFVARELAYQLQDSGARFLICRDTAAETAVEAAASAGFPKDNIFVFDDGYATFDGQGKDDEVHGLKHWSHLISGVDQGRAFAWKEMQTEEDLDETVCLNYSSGTTGVPKGVMITHKNYVANCAQVIAIKNLVADAEAINKESRWLCFLPMYHAYGQTYFCVTTAVLRIPTYIMQKFDFVKMLGHIQTHRITDLNTVPPIAVAFAKHPAVKKHDLSSVRFFGCGAAPLGREVCVEVERIWPDNQINVKQGWGMTEVTCSAVSWDPRQTCTSAAVGELNGNVQGRIMDDTGTQEMKRGERGELWIKGPIVMKGYWQKPEATNETLTEDGWLKTGDIAYLDEEGHLHIVDRKKELIKVKGNQVAPAELEAVLLDHASIADAAVIGVTVKGEELPRAYLVRQDGAKVTAADIHEFMRTKVARHKRLTGGVVFIDMIPKNPSGKILRKMLRDQAKMEVGDSEARDSRL